MAKKIKVIKKPFFKRIFGNKYILTTLIISFFLYIALVPGNKTVKQPKDTRTLAAPICGECTPGESYSVSCIKNCTGGRTTRGIKTYTCNANECFKNGICQGECPVIPDPVDPQNPIPSPTYAFSRGNRYCAFNTCNSATLSCNSLIMSIPANRPCPLSNCKSDYECKARATDAPNCANAYNPCSTGKTCCNRKNYECAHFGNEKICVPVWYPFGAFNTVGGIYSLTGTPTPTLTPPPQIQNGRCEKNFTEHNILGICTCSCNDKLKCSIFDFHLCPGSLGSGGGLQSMPQQNPGQCTDGNINRNVGDCCSNSYACKRKTTGWFGSGSVFYTCNPNWIEGKCDQSNSNPGSGAIGNFPIPPTVPPTLPPSGISTGGTTQNGGECRYSLDCKSKCCTLNVSTQTFQCNSTCSIVLFSIPQTHLSQAEMRALLGQQCSIVAGNIFTGTVTDDIGNLNSCTLRCNSKGEIEVGQCVRPPVIPPNENLCSENCGTSPCKDGKCAVISNIGCGTEQSGQIRPNAANLNSYLECKNNVWQTVYNGTQLVFDSNCPNSWRDKILNGIAKTEGYLAHGESTLNIKCDDYRYVGTTTVGGEFYGNTLELTCTDPAGCDGTIWHELGHIYAYGKYNDPNKNNPEYNQRFCQPDPNNPVKCSEEFANNVAAYISNPGNLQSSNPAVYEFIKNSVFNGKEY